MGWTGANGLLVAPAYVMDKVLGALRPALREPLLEQTAGTPWEGQEHLATLVLHDVLALSPREQVSLLAWLEGAGRQCRLIGFSPLRVFPLVEDAGFLAPLYYRLNWIYAEHTDST